MHLRHLTNLEMINLEATLIRGDGLRALRRNKRLAWIILDRTEIDDSALQHLAAFPALKTVRLRHLQRVSDAGLIHLRGLQDCECLDLTRTGIDGSGLAYLLPASRMINMKLSDTKLTDEGLRHLGTMTSLREFDAKHTQITDNGLQYLGRLTELRQIEIEDTTVTSAGIAHLVGLKKLDAFSEGLTFLLGHNIIAFDLPHLQAVEPDLAILALPAVDTLRLNPLAFPRTCISG